jgi:hypothetical protein
VFSISLFSGADFFDSLNTALHLTASGRTPYDGRLHEFYRITFRKKIYTNLADLQSDLQRWLTEYNETRVHQGRWCDGRTPMQTFLDTIPLAKEKLLAA